MSQFIHPSKDDITLVGIMNALGDPLRLKIVKSMMNKKQGVSCSQASPCNSIAKSTLSHHFRILREAGLVRTTKNGVEHCNLLRKDDIEEKFPGLLKAITKHIDVE